MTSDQQTEQLVRLVEKGWVDWTAYISWLLSFKRECQLVCIRQSVRWLFSEY